MLLQEVYEVKFSLIYSHNPVNKRGFCIFSVNNFKPDAGVLSFTWKAFGFFILTCI